MPDATRERRRERERVGGRGRGMSMSVVIHMATYLRPRHVLGILIGSQKQETFLSLSPIAVCYVQPSRDAEGGAEGAERVQGTGDWDRSCSHCPFVACFSAHFGLLFFFLLLLLLPGANCDSTSRLQAKRLGQEVMHMSGSLGVRRKICQWRRQPPSGRQQAGSRQAAFLHVACKFSLHTQQNFVANPRCTSHPSSPSQSCTCATPLLELTSSIFRIFCNTIFILYLRIFSALPLSLLLSPSLSHCTSSFVVVVVVAAGNRKP